VFGFSLQGWIVDWVDWAGYIIGVGVLDVDEGSALLVKLLGTGDLGVTKLPVLQVFVGEGRGSTLFGRFVLTHNLVDEAVDGAFYHFLSVGGVFFSPVIG